MHDDSFNPFSTPHPNVTESKVDEHCTPLETPANEETNNKQSSTENEISATNFDDSFNPFNTPLPAVPKADDEESCLHDKIPANNTILPVVHTSEQSVKSKEEENINRRLTFNTPQRKQIVVNTPHSQKKQIKIDLPCVPSVELPTKPLNSDSNSNDKQKDLVVPSNILTPSRLEKWAPRTRQLKSTER